MPGRKDPHPSFRETTVLVRTDILESAQRQGIDLSDTVNRALAEEVGIDYPGHHLNEVPVPPPVIIAKDGGVPSPEDIVPKSRPVIHPPVINADDPAAAGVIARSRKPVQKKPAPVREEPLPEAKAVRKAPPGPGKSEGKKPQKGDALKKFIATKIIREDSETAAIGKEDLYLVFSRWCREQKFPVPEAKPVAVALKTRFAFTEKTVQGSPCWTHVRLK